MFTKKENYRQFESARLIFMAGGREASTQELAGHTMGIDVAEALSPIIETAAETPDASRDKVEAEAEAAKKKVDANVDDIQERKDELDERTDEQKETDRKDAQFSQTAETSVAASTEPETTETSEHFSEMAKKCMDSLIADGNADSLFDSKNNFDSSKIEEFIVETSRPVFEGPKTGDEVFVLGLEYGVTKVREEGITDSFEGMKIVAQRLASNEEFVRDFQTRAQEFRGEVNTEPTANPEPAPTETMATEPSVEPNADEWNTPVDIRQGSEVVDSSKVVSTLFENRDTRFALIKFMAPDSDPNAVDQEKFAKMIETHPQLSVVIDSVQAGPEGEFVLDEKGREALGKAIEQELGLEGIKKVDRAEVDLLDQWKPEGAEEKDKPLGAIYGTDTLNILSMRYDFRDENGVVQVENDGEWRPLTQDLVRGLLPEDIRNAFDQVMAEGSDENKEAFNTVVEKELSKMSNGLKLRDLIMGKESGDNTMGTWEKITQFLQLLPLLKAAMESGDIQTLGDAFNDFQNGRNITESMEKARGNYEIEINKMSLATMMEVYKNPNGNEAKIAFGSGEAAMPYRIIAKDVIKENLEKRFDGPKIESIEGNTIIGNIGASKFQTDLEIGEGFDAMTVYKVDSEGNLTLLGESVKFNGLEDLGRVFNEVRKRQPASAQTTEAYTRPDDQAQAEETVSDK